ncbi:MAG: response regulator [Anaerolineae bacterium]|jgi:signal transduction histidine kinase
MHEFSSVRATDVRILIVDDSRDLVEVLSDVLSSEGYQVESCGDGESGWKRIVAGAEGEAPMPDLLLLDLMMPGVDGLTLLRRIRADERCALLPVIILTVQDDSETRLAALELGANDYLSKPVESVELLARVKSLLGWRLVERLRRQRMEHLIEAGRILLSTLGLENVLERVMQIVTAEMDSLAGSVWLLASHGGLECRAAYGSGKERLVGIRLEPGEGIVGWALEHKRSVLVANAQADPRFCSKVDEEIGFHTRDLVAVPLFVRRRGIGVLAAINKRGEPFSPADLEWLEVLAPLAAAAMANAQLFQTLRQRTVELRARNEELDAFSHTVAHDLQNPLGLIIGFAEALQGECEKIPGDELRKHLRSIARIGRRMGNIIDELLLLAQVRKTDVEVRPLDMEDVVAAALQQLTYMIEEHEAEVILPEDWPLALGYGPWVQEVWVNYISNAIKYGGEPPRVEAGAEVQSDGEVRFWVRDNGPGLTSEAQTRLFTPFTQLGEIRAKGHGLGLSIARRIVEKLGGQVGVESEVGEGSVFTFTLSGVDSEGVAIVD